jgi:5-methylcytosine-specific restriction endonuclease McrA
MMELLHTQNVLRLNGNYMRIGWSTVAEAFCMLMGEQKDGAPPALGVEVIYPYDEFNVPQTDKYSYINTWEWEYWMELAPRKGDLDKVIHTSKRIIRIPTIIVCPKFHMMPTKEQRPTKTAIRRRDGNKCQYTGVELTNKTFTLDHVIPRSKGGKDTWENLASCHKDFNFKKGDKYNHEIGAKLAKKLVAPKDIPLCALVTGNFHPDHNHF